VYFFPVQVSSGQITALVVHCTVFYTATKKIPRIPLVLKSLDEHHERKQNAQLSQRGRATGCVIVLAKSGRLELEDNISRTL